MSRGIRTGDAMVVRIPTPIGFERIGGESRTISLFRKGVERPFWSSVAGASRLAGSQIGFKSVSQVVCRLAQCVPVVLLTVKAAEVGTGGGDLLSLLVPVSSRGM